MKTGIVKTLIMSLVTAFSGNVVAQVNTPAKIGSLVARPILTRNQDTSSQPVQIRIDDLRNLKDLKKAQSQLSVGGVNGGGGGGIMINGVFYTLAQAGLKLQDDPIPGFDLDSETVSTTVSILREIENVLPAPDRPMLRKIVFGSDHIYKKLKLVDPKLFNSVRAQYAKYVASLKAPAVFDLIAYTGKDRVTYLLPGWDEASLEARALFLLTHESSYFVNPNEKLENILRTEIALYEFHRSPSDPDRMMSLYKSMATVGLLSWQRKSQGAYWDFTQTYYLHTLALKGIQVRVGNILQKSDILAIVKRVNPNGLQTDVEQLQAGNKLDPNFFSIFFRTHVGVQGIPFTWQFCPELNKDGSSISEMEYQKCADVVATMELRVNGLSTSIYRADGIEVVGLSFYKQ